MTDATDPQTLTVSISGRVNSLTPYLEAGKPIKFRLPDAYNVTPSQSR